MGTEDAPVTKRGNTTIASHLKKEREIHAWTQSEVAERIGTTQINISRWENGVTVPSPYYRRRLGELFGKSIQELGFVHESHEDGKKADSTSDAAGLHSPTSPSSLWHIPYRRNPFFTGREEILVQLHDVLGSSTSAGLAQPLAINGLGGIGKTQIAVEYAYRYRDHYQAVFWIDASTRDSLSADFILLAALLNLPEQHDQEQHIVVRAVKRWLTAHTHWLLILDNVDDLELLIDFLPLQSSGAILLTTRLQALGTVAQSIPIQKMELDEGATFLLRRTKILQSSTTLDAATNKDRTQASTLVTLLDGLPLALDQAGAYIEETCCGLSQYINLYNTRRKELLLRRGTSSTDHRSSVAATWSLSFQQVELENVAAADLLRVLAFLDPEAIPEELISSNTAELGPALMTVGDDPLKIDEIIQLLLRYSLIRRIPEARFLSIHRLVQVVLRDGMNRDTQRVWAERTIRVVHRAFPDLELHTWGLCQQYLPHVYMCATYSEEYGLAFPEAAQLFNEAASYLVMHARYEQAELLLLRALALRQQILPINHDDIALTLNDLGALYLKSGKYQRAETLLQESLTIRQQVLGMEHADVAQTLHNIASLYRAQGAYVKAEPFHEQALRIREKVLGINHPLVAQSYYGLAKLYFSCEKYQQAEQLCKQALHIQEQHLGNQHPLIASTLSMLANIYYRQNKYEEATKTNIEALSLRETISGLDHPHIATITNNLVAIYHAQGKYKEARPLIARALKIHEQSLGPEHPYMAYSLSNQAENFFLSGDYDQAEMYYKQALTIREQCLGVNHPHTASTYYNLAQLYSMLEQYSDAELFYRKTLVARERAFGLDHPIVIRTLEQYAVLLRKLQRESEAGAVEARIQMLGVRPAPSGNTYFS